MNKVVKGDIAVGDIVVRKNNKNKILGKVLKIWKREDRCVPIKNTWNDYRRVKGGLMARVEWENNYTSTIKASSLIKVDSSKSIQKSNDEDNNQGKQAPAHSALSYDEQNGQLTGSKTLRPPCPQEIKAIHLKFLIKKYRWIQYQKVTFDSYLVIRKDIDGYGEDADIYYIVALYHKYHDTLETFTDLNTAKNYYQEQLSTYL